MLGCLRQAIRLDLRTVSSGGEQIEAGRGGEGGGVLTPFLIRLLWAKRRRKRKMEEEGDRVMERKRGSGEDSDRQECVFHTLNLYSPPAQTDCCTQLTIKSFYRPGSIILPLFQIAKNLTFMSVFSQMSSALNINYSITVVLLHGVSSM